MPFDGVFIHYLCKELQAIAGARVDKIHQPAKDELVLHLRGRDTRRQLLLCATPSRARAGLITQSIENPAQPTMLCMLLRKHLTGARLTEISQPGLERVLRFELAGTSETGEPTRFTLCAEFTGRRPNLIFLREDGTILDAVRRVELEQGRPVLPGLAYTPPPAQGKRSLLAGEILPLPARDPEAIVAAYDGISPLVARELCSKNIPLDAQLPLLLREGTPYLYRNERGVPSQFSYMPLTHLGRGEEIESFSRLLERFYEEKDRLERGAQRTAALVKLCETQAARARRKIEARRSELAGAQNREHLRVCAELILANRARLERDCRGCAAYRLENYYDENRPIVVEANPALSPSANAQRYFKLYRKAKTAAELLGALIEQGQWEAAYLDSAADFLRRAESQADIDALREELEAQGYLRQKPAKKSIKHIASEPLQYKSSEGLRILVGRSNTQNDRLTLKTARGDDLWFHAKEYPGAHVILCAGGKQPGERSILEAAMVAAWHSKARGPAAVDYTPVRHLKKPAGAPPGQIIYHTYRSLFASPTRAQIDALLQEGEDHGRH